MLTCVSKLYGSIFLSVEPWYVHLHAVLSCAADVLCDNYYPLQIIYKKYNDTDHVIAFWRVMESRNKLYVSNDSYFQAIINM